MPDPEPTSRRDRKKAETRARITEVAAALFRANGYQATSIGDITEAADVAARTFYSYFQAKVDVAMVQVETWADDLLAAMEARPEGESPMEVYRNALADLTEQGYVTHKRLRDQDGRPFPPVGVGVLLAETEPEVAGRVYQLLLNSQNRMTELFRGRLGYPLGAIEPRVVAAAITAAWFVAVHGFSEVAAVDPDPPSTDDLATAAMAHYASGLERLWEQRSAVR